MGTLTSISVAAHLYAIRRQLLPEWPSILTEILPLLCLAVSLALGLTVHLRLRHGYLDAALSLTFAILAMALGAQLIAVYGHGSLRSPFIGVLHSTSPHVVEWIGEALIWLLE